MARLVDEAHVRSFPIWRSSIEGWKLKLELIEVLEEWQVREL